MADFGQEQNPTNTSPEPVNSTQPYSKQKISDNLEYARARPTFAQTFFSTDNPLWTLVPLILSMLALYFAYKSNIISREWADAHLRLTSYAFLGISEPENAFQDDGTWYVPGRVGSLENVQKFMNDVTLATNELGMKWLAESVGVDLEDFNVEDWVYNEYFVYFGVTNDGDQITEDLYIKFDHYILEDLEAFRGETVIPEGVEPEEWMYGPGVLAPGCTIFIPVGSSYVRMNPLSDEMDIQNRGSVYIPVEITYHTAVGGDRSIPVDFENIPATALAFQEVIDAFNETRQQAEAEPSQTDNAGPSRTGATGPGSNERKR